MPRAGLQVLLSDGHVFECHSLREDAIYFSELGASAAILAAGFNLDCLMLRYAGVDWRQRVTWGCNGRRNPSGHWLYDGVDLDPLEVCDVCNVGRVMYY